MAAYLLENVSAVSDVLDNDIFVYLAFSLIELFNEVAKLMIYITLCSFISFCHY